MASLVVYVLASFREGWRRPLADDLTWFHERTERLAPALAICLATALAAIGLIWGTYAASGADSYGYLSQADLWATGRIVQAEPLAARFGWTNVDGVFSPLGYRPGIAPHTIVPIYSPGLPLMMAAAKLVAGRCGPHLVVPASAFALVWLTFALGRHVLSQRGALAAATLVATSPITIFQSVFPMTDVPVTAAWTMALVLLMRDGVWRLVASGLAVGLTILIRPNLAPIAAVPVAALLLTPGLPVRLRLQRAIVFSPGVLAAVVFVAVLNNHLYGSPFRAGYDALPDLFSWANVPFNARLYAERFAQTATPAILLALVPLFVPAFRHTTRDALTVRVLFYGTMVVLLALYLPYARFGEWWYLRFLLPLYPGLYVAFWAGGAWVLSRLSPPAAFAAGVIGVALLSGFGIERSIAFGAFGMQRYEARYVAVGRWIGEHLPPNAIVLSKQHSGSVRYYAPRPTIRYDRIESMHAVIADLVRAGYHPYLLIEDWERPEFTNRFLGVGFERLSWQPLARMHEPEPLALFDLLDRASQDAPQEIPEVAPACGQGAAGRFSTP